MYYILEDRCVHLFPCYRKTKFVSKFSLPFHVNKLLEHRLGYETFLARLAIGNFLDTLSVQAFPRLVQCAFLRVVHYTCPCGVCKPEKLLGISKFTAVLVPYYIEA